MEKEEYKILLGFVLGMGALSLLFGQEYLSYAGLGTGFLGLFWAGFRRYFVKAWLWLGATLGAINSRIILTLIFFLLLVPIALLSRLFSRKDVLQIKRPEGSSSFAIRNKKYQKEDLEKMW